MHNIHHHHHHRLKKSKHSWSMLGVGNAPGKLAATLSPPRMNQRLARAAPKMVNTVITVAHRFFGLWKFQLAGYSRLSWGTASCPIVVMTQGFFGLLFYSHPGPKNPSATVLHIDHGNGFIYSAPATVSTRRLNINWHWPLLKWWPSKYKSLMAPHFYNHKRMWLQEGQWQFNRYVVTSW